MSSSTFSMINHDARLASFDEITKPKSRAKPAFPLLPSQYPHLTPANLSAAGFFHSPGSDEESIDTCRCFLCGLKLGGWDEGDDPFEEHVKRGQCAWAEFICQPRVHAKRGTTMTWKDKESLPTSEESVAFRETTYLKAWPHKARSGWIPTVRKLCEAGFVFMPSSGSKDAVMCPLCEYSVEGWEAEDDPWSIHQNKSPSCPFFLAQVESGSTSQAKPAGKASKKTTKRTTKAAESQQSQTQSIVEESLDQPESSTSQTKPRKKATTKARTKKAVAEAETDEDAGSIAVAEAEEAAPKRSTRTRGKGKGKEDDEESIAESAMESVVEDVELEEFSKPSKKGSRKTGRKTITQKSQSQPAPAHSESESDIPERATASQPTKSTSTRTRRQTQKPGMTVSEKEVTDEEMIEAEEPINQSQPAPSKSKSSRSTKKTKETQSQLESPVVDSEVDAELQGEGDMAIELPKKAKRQARPTKASKATTVVVSEAESEILASDIDEPTSQAQKIKSTSSRTRRETVKPKSATTSKASRSKRAEVGTAAESEAEHVEVDAPRPDAQASSRPTSQATSRSTSSKTRRETTKPITKGTAKSKKSVKSTLPVETDQSEAESVPPVETVPATVKKPSGNSIKKKAVESEPPVLSQLERFANIPPSSPFPNATPNEGKDENADTTPRARPVIAPSTKVSAPAASLRDQQGESIVQPAQSRSIIDDILVNIVGAADDPSNLRAKLTDEERSMTLEQFIRSEYEKRRQSMQKQGEEMIEKFEERTRQERRRIEML